MALTQKSKRIGVIAEDVSDVEVIRAVLSKYLAENDFSIRRFVGGGCGKLRKKCGTWADILWKGGCRHLVVLHDLDDRNESELRQELEAKTGSSNFVDQCIVIPIHTIEAWMLSDARAIQAIFNLRREPRLAKQTENIDNPKKYLRDAVWRAGRKRYLHTVHNSQIASQARLTELRRCPSYRVLDRFLKKI